MYDNNKALLTCTNHHSYVVTLNGWANYTCRVCGCQLITLSPIIEDKSEPNQIVTKDSPVSPVSPASPKRGRPYATK